MNAPGLVESAGLIASHGIRSVLRSKLLIGIGLAAAFSTTIAAVIHAYADSDPAENFQALQMILLSPVVIPLVALLVGTSAMATERENGTLAYLFTRPIRRGAVVVGKALAAILVANLSVVVIGVLVFVASGAPAGGQFVGGLLALLLESTAFTAIFVLLGTLVARSLYVGLAYIILFEGVMGTFVAVRSLYTVTYHARNLLDAWSSAHLSPSHFPPTPDPASLSLLALLLVPVGAMAAAALWVENREYGLRDRPKEE